MFSGFQPNQWARRLMTSFFAASSLAADEEVMIAGDERWVDHYLAVHGIERFDDARIREGLLNSFPERIGIAKAHDHRAVLGLLEGIRYVDQDFAAQGSGVDCAQRLH